MLLLQPSCLSLFAQLSKTVFLTFNRFCKCSGKTQVKSFLRRSFLVHFDDERINNTASQHNVSKILHQRDALRRAFDIGGFLSREIQVIYNLYNPACRRIPEEDRRYGDIIAHLLPHLIGNEIVRLTISS